MKNNKFRNTAVLVAVLAGVVAWSPPNSEDLVMGWGNSLDSPNGAELAVIGNSNQAKGESMLLVGDSNISHTTTTNSAIVGYGNILSAGKTRTLVVGTANSVDATSSFAAGWNNTLRGSTLGSHATHSSAIGYSNLVATGYGWAMGNNNEVYGYRSVAIGTGCRSGRTDSTALGRFNQDMAADDVLVVGSGSSDTARETALSVKADGTVLLGMAQGDISMGNYQ